MPKTWTGSEWRRVSDAEATDLHGKGFLVAADTASDDAPADYKGPLAPRDKNAPTVPNAAVTSAHGDPFDPRGTPTQLPRDAEDAEREKRGLAPAVQPSAPARRSPEDAPSPTVTDRPKK